MTRVTSDPDRKRTHPGPKVERPTSAQLDAMRKAAHEAVEQCVNSWPAVIRRIREYERGITGGEGAIGTGWSDPTGNAALEHEDDPATELKSWLRSHRALLGDLFTIADESRRLLGRLSTEAGRRNTVDVCAACGNPALKVRRIDGEPHCLACYDILIRPRPVAEHVHELHATRIP